MGGVTGLLTNLIMIGVVLYVGVNFVLPLAQKAVSGGTGCGRSKRRRWIQRTDG